MPRIVVVLPVGGAVLPVAALPALRATAQVFADTTIPEKVALAAGAVADSAVRHRLGAAHHRSHAGPRGGRGDRRAPGDGPARRRGRDGPAALARRLPLGRRADPRVAAAVPGGGVLRALPGDRGRRRCRGARGARRRAAAGAVPRAGGFGGGERGASQRAPASEERTELGSRPSHGAESWRTSSERRRATSFDIDDVAADLVAKLVGRHPHVFAGNRADRHRGAPGAPLGGAQAGREAARLQRGRRAARPAGRRAGSEADQPDGPRRAARRPAARRGRAGGAAVRRRGPGQAGRRRPGGGAAHRGPPVRRRRPRRRTLGAGRGPGPARARRRRLARPLAETAVQPFAAPCGQPDVRRACGCRARTCCRAAARSPRRRSSRSTPRAGSRGGRP